MASIVFADSTLHYDGRDLERRPLGGTETSVIRCARELARRGHQVTCFTNCDGPVEHEGVVVAAVVEHAAAAMRSLHRLSPAVSAAVRAAAETARDLGAVAGEPAAALQEDLEDVALPADPGAGQPLSGEDLFADVAAAQSADRAAVRTAGGCEGPPPLASAPPRHAIFASNPSATCAGWWRSGRRRSCRALPMPILDVYGVHQLAPGEDAWTSWEGNLLPPGMPAHVKASVRVHPSASRQDLIAAMRGSRVMLYLGHKSESFCIVGGGGAGARRAGRVRAGDARCPSGSSTASPASCGRTRANSPSGPWRC